MLRMVKTLDINNIYNINDIVTRMDDSLILENRTYKEGNTIPSWNEYTHHSIYINGTKDLVCNDWYQYHDGGKIIGEGVDRIFDLHLNGIMVHINPDGYIKSLSGSNVIDNETFITDIVMWGRKKKNNN